MAPPKLHAEKRRSFAIYGNNNSDSNLVLNGKGS